MNITFNNVSVTGMAVTIPKNVLSLSTLGKQFGEMTVKRIMASTGISAVRVADKNVKSSDLCMIAVKKLLDETNIRPKEIDAIVFVSQTHDAVMPATSVMMQHRLGLSTDTVAFDISYGCSGYFTVCIRQPCWFHRAGVSAFYYVQGTSLRLYCIRMTIKCVWFLEMLRV